MNIDFNGLEVWVMKTALTYLKAKLIQWEGQSLNDGYKELCSAKIDMIDSALAKLQEPLLGVEANDPEVDPWRDHGGEAGGA